MRKEEADMNINVGRMITVPRVLLNAHVRWLNRLDMAGRYMGF